MVMRRRKLNLSEDTDGRPPASRGRAPLEFFREAPFRLESQSPPLAFLNDRKASVPVNSSYISSSSPTPPPSFFTLPYRRK